MAVVAIIVAAGSGNRFGSKTPKQFLELAGKPVIFHTLKRFDDSPSIDRIVLVLPPPSTNGFLEQAAKHNLQKLKSVVAGGATRIESVWNGFKTINSNEAQIVAVHDGARPLVTIAEIERTIKKAQETGAACLVAPVTDTIKEIASDGKILRTINRNLLRRALTPQCFSYELLRRAFSETDVSNEQSTDESLLIEKLGQRVSIVEGSSRNIKITVPEDLIVAESLLKLIQSENV